MTRSMELAPKKKGNCNVVATWPRHMISLVIISNDIPLSPPIALTYYLVPDGSPFQYTKPHSAIFGNWLSYIAVIEKPTSCYLICWETLPPSSYCNFDIYSLTSHLLGCNLFWSNFIGIWTTSYSLTNASWWRIYRSILQPGRWLAMW